MELSIKLEWNRVEHEIMYVCGRGERGRGRDVGDEARGIALFLGLLYL